MRVLVIALLTAVAAQASLVDRKRAGRDLQDGIAEDIIAEHDNSPVSYKDDTPCGVLFAPPCKDDGCAPGLILDAVGWYYFVEGGFLSDIASGSTCRRRLSDASSDRQRERKLFPTDSSPTCVPCGELGQLPCTPCEGECVPKCSEGLVATNFLGIIDDDCRRRLENGCEKDMSCNDFPEEFLTLNFCAPCGADGQPPCDDTGCLPGHVAQVGDGLNALAAKCVECGGHNKPVCEDGCRAGTAANSFGICRNCGGENQPCCCDSSEYDMLYNDIFNSNNEKYNDGTIRETLLNSVIENASADPAKCLAGCEGKLRCGVNNVCYDNSSGGGRE